jgi:hypothetical protein
MNDKEISNKEYSSKPPLAFSNAKLTDFKIDYKKIQDSTAYQSLLMKIDVESILQIELNTFLEKNKDELKNLSPYEIFNRFNQYLKNDISKKTELSKQIKPKYDIDDIVCVNKK